jgi:hypothetical protein
VTQVENEVEGDLVGLVLERGTLYSEFNGDQRKFEFISLKKRTGIIPAKKSALQNCDLQDLGLNPKYTSVMFSSKVCALSFIQP